MVHFSFMLLFGGDGDSDTVCPRWRTSIRSWYSSNRQGRSPRNRFHGTGICDPQQRGCDSSTYNFPNPLDWCGGCRAECTGGVCSLCKWRVWCCETSTCQSCERSEAPCCQVGINQLVSPQELLLWPAFDDDGIVEVIIITVEDDYVLVASARSDGKPAWLVAEQHAIDLYNGHEDNVHTSVEEFFGKQFHSVNWFAIRREWRWVSRWGGGFCGLFTLTRLVHVAFFGFVLDLDVLSNLAWCEANKAFQVAFVDCLDQHGNDQII